MLKNEVINYDIPKIGYALNSYIKFDDAAIKYLVDNRF